MTSGFLEKVQPACPPLDPQRVPGDLLRLELIFFCQPLLGREHFSLVEDYPGQDDDGMQRRVVREIEALNCVNGCTVQS